MLPTAGLFLPETLHRAEFPTTAPTGTEGTKLKYFQRKHVRPKQDRKESEGRSSITAPDETRNGPSTDFPAISTAYSFADHVLSSEKASPDLLTFANIIRLVRIDTEEANRLYISSVVANFLDSFPAKRIWIESSLQEVQCALNDIGKDMDVARGQEEDNSIASFKRKIDWGLKNQKRLLKKQQQLSTCHSQLTGAIYVMQTAELCGKPGTITQDPIFEAPARPWVPHNEMNAQRGPYSRKNYRTSQANLSASNLTLSSEAQWDDAETTSVNSLPVELAGSTPDDLNFTGRHNSQDFLIAQVSREFIFESPSLLRRPRARSDYYRSTVNRNKLSRASIDILPPSSTVEDTTLERNDLAGYVMPNNVNTEMPDREWTASPNSSVPSISLTSSPVIDHTLPAVPETTPSIDEGFVVTPTSAVEGYTTPQLVQSQDPSNKADHSAHQQDITLGISATETQDDIFSRRGSSDTPKRSTSSLSYHSLSADTPRSPSSFTNFTLPDNEPVRRPSSQRPSQRISKRRSHISSKPPTTIGNTEGGRSQGATPTLTPDTTATMNTNDVSRFIAVQPTDTPQELENDDIVLSVLQERLSCQLQVKIMAENLMRAATTELTTSPSTTAITEPAQGSATDSTIPPTSEQPRPLVAESQSSPSVNDTAQDPTPVAELPASIPRKRLPDPTPIAAKINASSAPSIKSEEGGEKKPMTAMAKRRAAHARRMHIAFGGGKGL
ncbi:hypothetical protein PTNB73_06610 [Pyrenophora teres f. teres]|uniref:Uncharacterized protein n=1 Tax=Pyrenophora teres f. teres TaxID=97479 RepID=A0A6S6W5U8_9PLEO|nr:hypothetical protein HRS9139_07372 [Pyrenophora teres f. teres]KAE8829427.1 hypothetical protein HRS9122_09242 [Pyrenophora teres f. teres]KAE8830751.1 hypothetical protein PTNB85_07338 [Pyrenophora teres f. teres]KAE8857250.1 hypothetical protein PTNB29_08317 [Pyrenophora teres f. teres]KAE8863403.1 hypothetical protein PTNB73_06610 [Pyrenophora teres f. teres]